MESIQHKYINARGLQLHVAEIGTGPTVVFLHGFPEIWYSWRYQMIAVANAGFRGIAFDYRGYGLSEQPQEPEKRTFKDLVYDLLAILDSLKSLKVFVIGKDFGKRLAYQFALIYPDRVAGIATLGVVPSIFTGLKTSPLEPVPEGLYMKRWEEPGRAEKEFSCFDVKTVLKKIYILFSRSELPIAKDNEEVMDLVKPSTPLPSWFSEQDLATYAALYENSGFRTPLHVPFRALGEDYGVSSLEVKVPAMVIMGGNDYSNNFLGSEDDTSEKVKMYIPNLEIAYLPDGTHFMQEQLPNQVSHLIISFLQKHILEIEYQL